MGQKKLDVFSLEHPVRLGIHAYLVALIKRLVIILMFTSMLPKLNQ